MVGLECVGVLGHSSWFTFLHSWIYYQCWDALSLQWYKRLTFNLLFHSERNGQDAITAFVFWYYSHPFQLLIFFFFPFLLLGNIIALCSIWLKHSTEMWSQFSTAVAVVADTECYLVKLELCMCSGRLWKGAVV